MEQVTGHQLGYVVDVNAREVGERHEGDPPILSVAKVSDGHTVAVVLGLEIDTVHLTILPPATKMHNLRDLLDAWHPTRVRANVTEVRSLVGKLLHVSKLVRPGKKIVRSMLHSAAFNNMAEGERVVHDYIF